MLLREAVRDGEDREDRSNMSGTKAPVDRHLEKTYICVVRDPHHLRMTRL
jgi:hypothetical protein